MKLLFEEVNNLLDVDADTLTNGSNADSLHIHNLSSLSGQISDAQHGNRGGEALHSIATQSSDGFLANFDKVKIDFISVTQAVNLDAIELDTGLNNAHRGLVTGNPHGVTAADVGAISGSIALNQVAVGSGTDSINGSTSLLWDGTTFTVKGLVIFNVAGADATTTHSVTDNEYEVKYESQKGIELSLISDTDNVDESHTARIFFSQDSGAKTGVIGLNASAGTDPRGGNLIGSDTNSLVLHHPSTTDGIQFGVNGQVWQEIKNGFTRIIGAGAFESLGELRFGDNNFVRISEDVDDSLLIYATDRLTLDVADGVKITQGGDPNPAAMLDVDGDTILDGNARISGTISMQGGMKMKITTIVAATYTILKSDSMLFANTTAQAITLTLPAIVAGSDDDGRYFRIQKILDSANPLTITPQAPSKINSEVTDTVIGLKNDNTTYMSFGGDWFIVNRDTTAFGAINLDTPGATQALTGTPTKLDVFDLNRFTTPGICIADQANGIVKIEHIESISLGGDGYRISFRVEISSFSNNQEVLVEAFVGGVGTNIQDVRSVSVGFNTVLEAEGLFQVASSPQDVELRISASSSATATFQTGQLIAERLIK